MHLISTRCHALLNLAKWTPWGNLATALDTCAGVQSSNNARGGKVVRSGCSASVSGVCWGCSRSKAAAIPSVGDTHRHSRKAFRSRLRSIYLTQAIAIRWSAISGSPSLGCITPIYFKCQLFISKFNFLQPFLLCFLLRLFRQRIGS